MGRYRSKPYEVEAWQYRCDMDGLDIMVTCPDAVTQRCDDPPGGTYLMVETLTGPLRADKADWILRGAEGGLFVLDPLSFKKQFEPADAATAIALNQVITPAQAPGKDEHTLERIDDAEAIEDLGPPALIAPYRRPADKRVKALLDEAARNPAAAAASPPRTIYSDPRLAPDYKPPKKLPPR